MSFMTTYPLEQNDQGRSPSLVYLIAALASLLHVLFLRCLLAGDAMYYHAQFFLLLFISLCSASCFGFNISLGNASLHVGRLVAVHIDAHHMVLAIPA